MKAKLIVLFVLVAVVFAEKEPKTESLGSVDAEIPATQGKKDKRGIFGYEFGLHHAGPIYHAVPIVHPVAIERHIPVPIKVVVPKPIYITKHVAVPVAVPVPVPVHHHPVAYGHHHPLVYGHHHHHFI